jgi:hypothetical protein
MPSIHIYQQLAITSKNAHSAGPRQVGSAPVLGSRRAANRWMATDQGVPHCRVCDELSRAEGDLGFMLDRLVAPAHRIDGERHLSGSIGNEMALVTHPRQFDAGQHIVCCAKGLETHHWLSHAFDRPAVLLDDVVEVLDLPRGDLGSHGAVDLVDGALLAPLLSMAILSGTPFSCVAASKKPWRQVCHIVRSRKNRRFSFIVDVTVEILPGSPDIDVRFICASGRADLALVLTGQLLGQRNRIAHRLTLE